MDLGRDKDVDDGSDEATNKLAREIGVLLQNYGLEVKVAHSQEKGLMEKAVGTVSVVPTVVGSFFSPV